jgi:hypothetical protein
LRPLFVSVAVTCASAVSAAPAIGQGVPPDNSGADQYAPSAPSAGGPRSFGSGGGSGGSLDPNIAARLGDGDDQILKALATDRGLGAPPSTQASDTGTGDSLLDSEVLILIALLAAIGAGGFALLVLRSRSDDHTPAT